MVTEGQINKRNNTSFAQTMPYALKLDATTVIRGAAPCCFPIDVRKGVSKADNDVYPCKKEVRKCVMLISISRVEILG